ncbi:3'-5' exonuclease [Pantoea vagans]|uniref:3'-5' exonuclease n=1 Tax=Pantoea vagans TaxID=470934 RepID=UPI00320AC42D
MIRKKLASQQAAIWLRENRVIIDTETTGLGPEAEIVEIAAINCAGRVLLNTFVRPRSAIPAEASAIHGITDEMVSGAPRWPEVMGKLASVIGDKKFLAYNADFDSRLLRQTSEQTFGSNARLFTPLVCWHECAMLLYADYRDEPGRDGRSAKWHRLEDAGKYEGVNRLGSAHRAMSDCLMTLGIIEKMARGGGNE